MRSELDEVNKEIESRSRVLSQTADDDTKRPLLLTCLGKAYSDRYNLLGEPDDIQKMIEYTTTVLTLIPEEDPDLLNALGVAHGQRFARLGHVYDLEKALEYSSRALGMIPENHPTFPSLLVNVATSHRVRFQRLDQPDDIEKAIAYHSRAVDITPNGDPRLPERFMELGTSHHYRFRRLVDPDDLEKATKYYSQGIALAPAGHPQLPIMLGNLARSHSDRYRCLGEMDDLETAIEYDYRALDLLPVGHPTLSRQLANLASAHNERFLRLGELDDVETAIQYQFRALALTPDDHPNRPNLLSDLGISHNSRFQHLGKLKDIEKAIEFQSRAVALTPDDHPDLSGWLANLGISHSYRFEQLEELNDIDEAIKHQSRAVDLTPNGHAHFSNRLGNLGASYAYRFHLLRNWGDLERAIDCQIRALDGTTEDQADFCVKHFNLALSYVDYYEHTNNPSHLRDSLNFFRIACKSPVGAPRDRFMYARRWATHALNHSELNCIEAYQTSIDLLPQFIWFGATTTQRYQDLKVTATLAVDAATAAIISSDYSLALEWLEHARCVVWNQNLMLRSPLDQLKASHPSLAIRLQTVASQLHGASSESRESRAASLGSLTPEQVGQEHRRLAKEYNQLLTQARALPGFEDFFQPIKANRLFPAARNGPIVVINCDNSRCDALLILPQQGNVNHILLPNFSGDKARRARSEIEFSVESQRLREREVERRPLVEEGQNYEFSSVLAVLWIDVVKPILDFLGFTNHVPVCDLPHITWCPTGAMTFLPLHAAGDYDQPRSRVFDYVISSYTPTITALLESTLYAFNSNSRVLAIGQTATPGHSPLPGTALELEIVKAHTQGKAKYSQLMDGQAITMTVLDEMERHDCVHLACHAHQNVHDATESGFFLHDGVLDLASINRRSLKNKGLAFLSACQTATGDEKLPDEAVHLASGMLMAGYTSVIATMWSVVDSDAPLVADKVYHQLINNGQLGNGEAGKALHNAVAGLRETVGEKEFGRWVPYIHIGS